MRIFIGLSFIVLISLSAHAESAINASDGSKVINGNTYSASVGEIITVPTACTENIFVTQGLIQSTPATVSIADITLSNTELKVYPNPIQNIFHLQVNTKNTGELIAYFSDIMGRELIRKKYKITSGKENHNLNLQGLAAGNYLLRAEFRDGQATAVQSFKIQKLR